MKLTKPRDRFTVLMDPKALRRVRITAMDDHVTTSELARRALKDYLARRKSGEIGSPSNQSATAK